MDGPGSLAQLQTMDETLNLPKIYLAIKYYPDHQNRSLIEAITAANRQAGYKTICVARDLENWGLIHFTAADLMQKSFELIRQSRYLMVEYTNKGTGLGIEAGFAFANAIPILTVLSPKADFSETLAGITAATLRYQQPQEITAFLTNLAP